MESQISCRFVNGVNDTIVGQSANLGPLRNNGGPTRTHALLAGSPAIDAGDTELTTDQRGELRPGGAADDIGAFEDTSPTAVALDSLNVRNQPYAAQAIGILLAVAAILTSGVLIAQRYVWDAR